jgi:hypothetical protein
VVVAKAISIESGLGSTAACELSERSALAREGVVVARGVVVTAATKTGSSAGGAGTAGTPPIEIPSHTAVVTVRNGIPRSHPETDP